ncbi:glycosyltransferase family 2 protein [Geobacter sulfurreducens]|uniref:Glycosyltransferase n=1 Tax=Geobacter sulfurreducens (strain ATCC 51573 / DSM 12127 / PCA) TaxID=243231 RepID=Q74B40_GEOSL|nr:glycosyltransferase family A protein [Geobacter sulfurreducens]AAR35338.1 glycosyltransferase [Geobacter sulfurreducens PCA]ADI84797.1 glycosyltransferase [Geobacter sulfurreducens KN400]UAC02699.1 glycosyltransferase family 2 protein [Geobacter sulfurreducens]HBB70662.1 glycosyltransferase family 2 protein [Geobacter sulfurreducens]HCD96213.1 glycosyltransferase family 2 protein [Geobacter sulfurreducens]
MPKLSIIIPAYNNAHLLPETLDSIFSQDCEPFELIVVDDGSTDNTRDVVEGYGRGIVYLWQENSGGCSKPRNVGIRHATGEYIAMFDSDDIMKPGKVRSQMDFLDRNPDVDFVFTDFCDFRGAEVLASHITTCPIFNSLPKQKVGEDAYVISSTAAYETLLVENFIGGSAMMFRKSLFNEAGPFDETLEVSEDIDFTLRVARTHALGFINRIGHHRRLHDGNMTSKAEKILTRSLRVFGGHLSAPKSSKAQQRLIDKVAGLHGALAYHYRENARYGEALAEYRASLSLRPACLGTYKAMAKLAVMALTSGGK